MKSIRLKSYSKINLTLEVGEKQPNGFHYIESIVQIIDIYDELVFTKSDLDSIVIETQLRYIPTDKRNIIHKASRAFFDELGIRGGVICNLTKNVPVQAGLGGGSANAAAAVCALNVLYDTKLSNERLAKIAAKAGSDSSLFIYGGTLKMSGRGEIIDVLPNAPKMHILVIKPEIGVSTPWAYNELDKKPRVNEFTHTKLAEKAVRNSDLESLIKHFYNDFDAVATSAFSEILYVKEALINVGAVSAMLSGSGSAVFGVFKSEKDATDAAEKLKNIKGKIYITRTLAREEL